MTDEQKSDLIKKIVIGLAIIVILLFGILGVFFPESKEYLKPLINTILNSFQLLVKG